MRFRGWKHVTALAVFAGLGVGLCTQTAQAQNQQGNVVEESFPDARIVGDAGTMNLNGVVAGDIVFLDLPANIPQDWSIDIPSSAWKNTQIDLSLSSVRTDNFVLHHQLANGAEVAMPAPAIRTYQGSIAGVQGSDARGSLLNNGLIASIWQPDGTRLVIQPLSDFIPGAQRGLHVVYRGEDTSCIGVCGNGVEESAHQLPNGFGERGSCGGGICIADLAIDMDTTYLATYGGSQPAQDRAEAVINVMNHEYTVELNIAHRLSFVLARTGAEPYVDNVIGNLLNALRTDWNTNRPTVTRDMTHLFTSRPTGSTIGLAYVAVVCDSNGFAYGVSQVSWSGTFGCQTDLVAHELGHNWSANHCTCTSSTMNPFITCANTFLGAGSGSIAEIDAHRDSRTCLTGGGTVPPNNTCENATRVTAGVTTGSNVGATTDGGTLGCGSLFGNAGGGENDVWFRFTAPASGTVDVTTCGSNFDTMLSVHTGCPGTPDNSLGCNDDSCGVQSAVSFSATQGATYMIRVAGYNGATGAITLNIGGAGAAPFGSDACGTAQPVTNGSYTGSIFNSTNTSGDSTGACGASATASDVWFSYTAGCAGTLAVDTCSSHDWNGVTDSGMDTVVSLYTTCGGTALVCNDDSNLAPGCVQAGSVRDSYVTTAVSAGQTILIRVASFNNAFYNGMFRLNVNGPVCPPPNDLCANATRIIQDGSYFATTNSVTGTEGTTACGLNGPDVFWLFTSPTTGTANINTCGSNFDTVLNVLPACGGASIVCNDDSSACGGVFTLQSSVSFGAVQGNTYIIKVNGYNGATGNIQLNVDAPVRASGDTCATATFIPNGSDLVGSLYDNGATVAGGCGGLATSRDSWFRYNGPNSGTLNVRTCGSRDFVSNGAAGVDTVIGIYNSCGGSEVTCNDQSGAPCSSVFDSQVAVPYTANTNVFIRVAHYGFGNPADWYGNGMFRVQASVGGVVCNDIDFNNDGSLFDPQDIDAFLSVFSEGPCIPNSATCDDIDFNNDGSVFDPCDIDAFLLVFQEGPCTLCGN